MATSDNAANEQKAYQILGWPRFGCYGHRINLIVKYALSIPEVNKTLGKARKLVTFFHQSSSITEMLYEKQKLLLEARFHDHKLIIDVPTRWNSTLYMLRRLVEQAPALMALANDPGLSKTAASTLKNCVFSFEELNLVESLVQLLDPFEKATQIVCADKTPTIHKVLPLAMKLVKVVAHQEDDHSVVKKVKSKMQEQIGKRTTTEETSLLACILNPFTKDLTFVPEEARNSAMAMLKEQASKLNVTVNVVVKTEKTDNMEGEEPTLPRLPSLDNEPLEAEPEAEAERQPQTKKFRSADADESWLDDIICTGEDAAPGKSGKSPAILEVERYISCKVGASDEGLTVLQWWKKNEFFFPNLSILAKRYLCVPASSVSSERVFSLAGELVNKKRSRLSPSNINMLIFLNKNLRLL